VSYAVRENNMALRVFTNILYGEKIWNDIFASGHVQTPLMPKTFFITLFHMLGAIWNCLACMRCVRIDVAAAFFSVF
jgi:hypothetical protein